MIYRKTQTGWLFITLMASVLLFLFLSNTFQWGDDPIPQLAFLIVFIAFVGVTLLFYQLTIELRGSTLLIVYGIGLIKIVLRIDEILSVHRITTPWYWGLGIRVTPKGMLYNLQGLKAVEIKYISKGRSKSVMVGTAEPEMLIRAIESGFK